MPHGASIIPAAALLRAHVVTPADMARLNPELSSLLEDLQLQRLGKCAFDANELNFYVLPDNTICLKSDVNNRRGRYFVIMYRAQERAYIACIPATGWTCWSRSQEDLLKQLNAHLLSASPLAKPFQDVLRTYWDKPWF